MPWLHNWASEVTYRTKWATKIGVAVNDAEERTGRMKLRPRRSIEFLWTSVTRSEALMMMIELSRASDGGIWLPVYPDVAETTATSSGTTINCPTDGRRWSPNLVILEVLGGRPINVQVLTVSSVGSGAITTSVMSGSYPAGSLVLPVLDSRNVSLAAAPFNTDDVAEIGLTLTEKAGDAWAGHALEEPGVNPSGFDTEGGWPILHLEPNWAAPPELRVFRNGELIASGLGEVEAVRGDRARWGCAMDMLLERDDALALSTFFDSRGGMLCPFWLPLPMALLDAAAVSTGHVDVAEPRDAEDATLDLSPDDFADAFPYLAVVLHDGTVYVRGIDSAADMGATWRLTLASSLPSLALADVRRVTPALFGRFTHDELEETWLTDGILRARVDVQELVLEAEVNVA